MMYSIGVYWVEDKLGKKPGTLERQPEWNLSGNTLGTCND